MKALATRADAFMTRHFTRPSISWKQSMAIVLPIIAEHLFTTLFGLLNTAMISSSGVTSLSAVSLVDSLNTFLFVIYTGISTGAGVVVANYRGRKDAEKLHEASVQAVTWVTLFTLMTSLFIIIFHVPLLKLLFGAAEQEVMDKARLYLLGGSLSLPFLGVTTAICGVLRGIGEGRTSLIYTGISTAKYVLLNVLFLSVLEMGIPGLILSITLSRTLNVPLLLLLLKWRHSRFTFKWKEFFHLNYKMFRGILKIGVPCATEQLFFTGGRLVTQSIIVVLGTNAIVTYNISYSIMALSQAIVTPISTAMFTISGICMGSNRPKDVRDLTKSYVGLGSALYVVSLGIIIWLFDYLVGFYHAPAEVIPLIYQCVLITGIAQPFIHCLAFMLPAVFRAVGDGLYSTIVTLIVMWVVRVFGGYVLGVWCGMGALGIWIAMVLDWVVRVGIFVVHFKGDKWLTHNVISD